MKWLVSPTFTMIANLGSNVVAEVMRPTMRMKLLNCLACATNDKRDGA